MDAERTCCWDLVRRVRHTDKDDRIGNLDSIQGLLTSSRDSGDIYTSAFVRLASEVSGIADDCGGWAGWLQRSVGRLTG